MDIERTGFQPGILAHGSNPSTGDAEEFRTSLGFIKTSCLKVCVGGLGVSGFLSQVCRLLSFDFSFSIFKMKVSSPLIIVSSYLHHHWIQKMKPVSWEEPLATGRPSDVLIFDKE